MSVKSSGEERPRLLPEALESSLLSWTTRTAGIVLVVFAVTSWLSLLSWQLSDATLAHAAVRPARNLLGSYGATTADLLIQTLGAAVVFALICPMVWGLEILSGAQRLDVLKTRLVAFPLALLALAGVASSLPTFPTWPLQGGGGGMLGDLVLNLATVALTGSHTDRNGAFAGMLLALAGSVLLCWALGLDVRRLAGAARGTAKARIDDAGRWFQFVPASLKATPRRTASPPLQAAAPAMAPSAPAAQPLASSGAAQTAQATPAGSGAAVSARTAAPPIADDVDEADEPGLRGSAFDEETDEHARAVAERFAPNAKSKRPAQGAARLTSAIKATLALARGGAGYRKPGLDLLRRPQAGRAGADEAADDASARLLEAVLADYGVHGEIREVRRGPVVTRYELEPVRGTKTARVVGLADDFARSMSTHAVRVAPTPGRSTIGIEVPNAVRQTVTLREVLESDAFQSSPAELPLALGVGLEGEAVVVDLARLPHLLIGGTTGSGKSVAIHAMILSLIYKHEPADCRLLLIDPKMLELAPYNGVPHLLAPVITDAQNAAAALEWAVAEMEDRYRRMAKLGVRNIEGYNAKARAAELSGVGLVRTVQTGYDNATGQAVYEHERLGGELMPTIVIVVDELADLMVVAGKRVEGAVQRLAQMARAAGIHLVMATQRPSVDVVTGTIKANLPVRLAFRVASKIDSRTIFNEAGAEQLLGHGDMLLASGNGSVLRVHGAFVGEDEVERVAAALRDAGEPRHVEALAALADGTGQPARVPVPARMAALGPAVMAAAPRAGEGTLARGAAPGLAHEEIYAAAVAVVLRDRKVSPGHLKRRLGIDEALGAELIGRMEQERLVGELNRFGRRPILAAAPGEPRSGTTRRSVA